MASVHVEEKKVHLRLPPPVLPPRQLKKVEIACRKWLARFFLTLSTAAAADEKKLDVIAARVCVDLSGATGFVVLNGGVLAGCTPHDLRAALVDNGVVSLSYASDSQACMLDYSSTLPFALCSRQLAVDEDKTAGSRLSQLLVPMTELRRYAAQMRASGESEDTASRASGSIPSATGEGIVGHSATASTSSSSETKIGVAVLQLPASAALWKGGSTSTTPAAPSSSGNKGSGFLFLLPCRVEAVQAIVGHLFQKPVAGIESLLAASVHERCENGVAAASATTGTLSEGQRTCVGRAVSHIPGLYLVEDFLTPAEEAAIWQELRGHREGLELEYLSRRRVAHFNRRFIYGANALTGEGEAVNPRPSFYAWMRARLQNDDADKAVRITGDYPFGPGDYVCDQLTVNYYDYSEMGACGIATHVDAHQAFDDAVLIVSLGSYTVMEFARWDSPSESAAPSGVYLAPRSLAVMTGEARYGWTHCIAEKRTDTVSELLPTLTRGDRLSLTWRRGRTQRHVKADCPFPALCDGE